MKKIENKFDNLIRFVKIFLKKILPRFLIVLLYQIENFIILSVFLYVCDLQSLLEQEII